MDCGVELSHWIWMLNGSDISSLALYSVQDEMKLRWIYAKPPMTVHKL